jgi:hypothetical protein
MLPRTEFIPKYYCGDNLQLALSRTNPANAEIIHTVYFNISEVGTDNPIYGHTSRYADVFAEGTRLVTGTFAVPVGEMPDWVIDERKWDSLGTMYVEPVDKDWPILQLKSVRFQGVHQVIQPDGSPTLHTASFIAVRKEPSKRVAPKIETQETPPPSETLVIRTYTIDVHDLPYKTDSNPAVLTRSTYNDVIAQIVEHKAPIEGNVASPPVIKEHGFSKHIQDDIAKSYPNGLEEIYEDGILLLELVLNGHTQYSDFYILIPATVVDPIDGSTRPGASHHKLTTNQRNDILAILSYQEATPPSQYYRDLVINKLGSMAAYNTWYAEQPEDDRPIGWQEAWELLQ